MQKYTVLVVEDDKEIRESIGIYLKNANYQVEFAKNGKEGLDIFQSKEIHIVIIDLMMPEMTGEETIIKLREFSYVPIIILSAKSEKFDKIVGLDIGADDYVTKPFDPLELLARVNSNIRRFYNYSKETTVLNDVIISGELELNIVSKLLKVRGESISITSTEYKILELLMSNPNRVFSVEQIYENVWNEPALDTKTVTVHIRRIREKIEQNPKNPRYIQVSWGIGYKFVP